MQRKYASEGNVDAIRGIGIHLERNSPVSEMAANKNQQNAQVHDLG